MHAIHFRPTVHLPREVVQSGRIAIVLALRTVLAGPGNMNGMGPRRRLQIPPEALLVLLFEPVAQGRQHGVVQRKALLQVADGENDVVDKPSHITDAPSPLHAEVVARQTLPKPYLTLKASRRLFTIPSRPRSSATRSSASPSSNGSD